MTLQHVLKLKLVAEYRSSALGPPLLHQVTQRKETRINANNLTYSAMVFLTL